MPDNDNATRAAYTAGLRQLADILDNHPEVPLPVNGRGGLHTERISFNFWSDDAASAMSATRRALGVPVDKDDSIDGYYKLLGSLHGLYFQMTAMRDAVCERVVVATREVEVSEPDAAAVAALPKVTRTVKVEDVRWKCTPLLNGDAR